MKKLVSGLLVAAMAFSCVGCALGTPKEIQNFLNVARDNGFVKYESKKDTKTTGAYQINVKSSAIDDIVDAIEDDFDSVGIPVPDADDLRNISTAQKISDDTNNFFAIMYVFEDEDDAEDLMEDIVEFQEENVSELNAITLYYDADCGYDTDDEACYFYLNLQYDETVVGLSYAMVREGNTVYIIFGHYNDIDEEEYMDLVDDFCDGFGFEQPSDFA